MYLAESVAKSQTCSIFHTVSKNIYTVKFHRWTMTRLINFYALRVASRFNFYSFRVFTKISVSSTSSV